ncbi:MAG: hypothetical protein R2880_13025 [Deinococcales bacterium]
MVRAELSFDSHIRHIRPCAGSSHYILPGFIDVHVHGGGGGDTMDGAEGLKP